MTSILKCIETYIINIAYLHTNLYIALYATKNYVSENIREKSYIFEEKKATYSLDAEEAYQYLVFFFFFWVSYFIVFSFFSSLHFFLIFNRFKLVSSDQYEGTFSFQKNYVSQFISLERKCTNWTKNGRQGFQNSGRYVPFGQLPIS